MFRKKLSLKENTLISEATATQNQMVRRFVTQASYLAKDTHTNSGILSLQILQSQNHITAALCQGTTIIKNIPLNKLALFFTHPTAAILIPASLIKGKLETYFASFQKHPNASAMGIRFILLKNEQTKIYTIGTIEILELELDIFIKSFVS